MEKIKHTWRRLRDYMDKSLRRQLVFYLMAGVILPLTVVTSVLFIRTRSEMKNQAVGNIRQRAKAVAVQVDDLIYNVQVASDKLAYDEELGNVINKEYGDISIEKQKDIYDLNMYFLKTDPLGKSQRLSAVYTRKGDVFNFRNPYLQGNDVKQNMVGLGATDRELLSMFRWSSVQDNFLDKTKTGDIRKDRVVFCVRRILHPFTGTWQYTQFFALGEETFHNIYAGSVAEMNGLMYLMNEAGELISSSDEAAVAAGTVPQEVLGLAEKVKQGKNQMKYKDEPCIVDLSYLDNADWRLITMVPVSAATAPIDRLFKEIIAAMVVCVIVCVAIISWISKRFLQPVEVLDASMKEVYDGKLEAYVSPDAYHGEIKSMMMYYNAMLMQINNHIRERVESEKKKKELELEVLMGQINPHFLYNTLENIVWKSNEVGRPDIGRIAASLGRLYRLSIGNGETIVPIRQEVEHVMAYVNIQKNRYKERVEFDISVNYDQIWDYTMIKLTLQPVVENCFMYGMEDIDRVLKIRLDIRECGEVIRFRVADNGCGMTKRQLEEVRRQIEKGSVVRPEEEAGRRKRKGTGIGLYSVKERIAIYSGYQDGLKVFSKAGSGTIVVITIPKLLAKDKNSQ